MKNILFVIAILAISAANAQDSLSSVQNTTENMPKHHDKSVSTNKMVVWSIGIEPSVPFGNFSNFSGFGLGGSLQTEFLTSKKLGITINAGYLDYFGKSADTIKYSDFKYWPIMGGLKYYMSGNSYLHAQAGPGFGSNGLGTSFWYGAGVGFKLSKALDAELRYMGWKQNEVSNSGKSGGGVYGGTGGTGGTGGSPYGGHYSTVGVRLAVNF